MLYRITTEISNTQELKTEFPTLAISIFWIIRESLWILKTYSSPPFSETSNVFHLKKVKFAQSNASCTGDLSLKKKNYWEKEFFFSTLYQEEKEYSCLQKQNRLMPNHNGCFGCNIINDSLPKLMPLLKVRSNLTADRSYKEYYLQTKSLDEVVDSNSVIRQLSSTSLYLVYSV